MENFQYLDYCITQIDFLASYPSWLNINNGQRLVNKELNNKISNKVILEKKSISIEIICCLCIL